MTKLKNNNKTATKTTKAAKATKATKSAKVTKVQLNAVQKKIKQLTGKIPAKTSAKTAKVKAEKTAPVKATKKNNTKTKAVEVVKTITLEMNSECSKNLSNVVHTFGSFVEKHTGGAVKRDSKFEVLYLMCLIKEKHKSGQPIIFQNQFEYINKVSASHCFTDKLNKTKKESLIDVKVVGQRITKKNGINERAGNDFIEAVTLNSKKASEFARVAYKIKAGKINLDAMINTFHSAVFSGELGKRKIKVIMTKE